MTTCHKCGMEIKNIYEFDGQVYGSTCVGIVSGVALDLWVWKDGKFSWEATKLSIAEKEAEKKRLERIGLENNKRFADLIVWLKGRKRYVGDYFWSLLEMCEDSQRLEPFSFWDIENMKDIYGKEHGRRGSKKYNQAVDEFVAKFNL